MSAPNEWVLRCDVAQCAVRLLLSGHADDDVVQERIAAAGRAAGWDLAGGRHTCPDCARETAAAAIAEALRGAFERLGELERRDPAAADGIFAAIVHDLRARRPMSVAPLGELPSPEGPVDDPRGRETT